MSSITHLFGVVFQPLLDLLGFILALFYSVLPNYPIDVALLTIVIMGALTPLTVKSTQSMAEMQSLAPELKKLQQKYKGPENRTELVAEQSKLYKEHNVNPAMGCILTLIQLPFFFVLYTVIRGITNTITVVVHVGGHNVSKLVAAPRYLPKSSSMYHSIVAAKPPGSLNAFGMDFAARLFSPHGSVWAALPFLFLVILAVGIQYFQMARLNARQPVQAEGPQAAVAKLMPLFFAFIYVGVAAIMNVYFIVSALVRIVTQEVMFAKGMVGGAVISSERQLPAAKGEKPTLRKDISPTNGGVEDAVSDDAAGDTSAAVKPKGQPRAKGKRARKPRSGGAGGSFPSDGGSS
jgi:YidC/Oxa1 family membrane protein insertase